MPHTYAPVGQCIYCGATEYRPGDTTSKLGDEHIIPLAWGGDLVLPEASCEGCGRETSGVESQCTNNMLDTARHALGLRVRRHHKTRDTLPVYDQRGPRPKAEKIPVADHPSVLFLFGFFMAELLIPLPPTEHFGGKIAMRPLVPDMAERVQRLGKRISLTRGFSAIPFARMLAKIAHSHLVAKLGLGAFRPLLIELILGRPPLCPGQFIGGNMQPEPTSMHRHEIIVPRYHYKLWKEVHRSQASAVRRTRYACLLHPCGRTVQSSIAIRNNARSSNTDLIV
jgi:hypothetical protein